MLSCARDFICAARVLSCQRLLPRAVAPIFGWILLCGQGPAPAASSGDLVIVRDLVGTAYDSHTVSDLISQSLSRTVAVNSGATLSGLISRLYGVGISNAPSAYTEFSADIEKRNGISSGQITAGTKLLVPDLPRIALTNPNTANPNNKVPQLSVDKALIGTNSRTSNTGTADSRNIEVIQAGRKGAATTVQYRAATRDQAQRLLAIDPKRYSVSGAGLMVSLAQASSSSNSESPLDEREAGILKQALSGAPKQRPILVVFDDSWPSDFEFEHSKSFLIDAIRDIRKHYNLPPITFSKELLGARKTYWTVPQVDGGPAHAQLIQTALAPFRLLEPPDARVEVMYIPLFASQQGAFELLQHIVALRLEARDRGGALGDPDDASSKNYWALAKTIVSRATEARQDGLLQTDQGVVEAVLWLLRYYSETSGRPYFVSMSWTTPNLNLDPQIPEDGLGLFVVAAGNEGDAQHTTVFELKRQFAYRALSPPGDMLAVMNVSDDGAPSCHSSEFGAFPGVFGLSFPGQLKDACGTSFSAPRVAWLIAAREAMRAPAHSVEFWKSDLHSTLASWVDASAPQYNRIRLKIDLLFPQSPH